MDPLLGKLSIDDTDRWLYDVKEVNPFVPAKLDRISSIPENANFTRLRVLTVTSQFGPESVRAILPYLKDRDLAELVERHVQEYESNPEAGLDSILNETDRNILTNLLQDLSWDPDWSDRLSKLLKQHDADTIRNAIDMGLQIGRIDFDRAQQIKMHMQNF